MDIKLIRKALKAYFTRLPAVFGDRMENDFLENAIAGNDPKVQAVLAYALLKSDGTLVYPDDIGTSEPGEDGFTMNWERLTSGKTVTAEDHGKILLMASGFNTITFSEVASRVVVGVAFDPGIFGGDLTLTTSGAATLSDPQLEPLEEGFSIPPDRTVYWFVSDASGAWVALLPEAEEEETGFTMDWMRTETGKTVTEDDHGKIILMASGFNTITFSAVTSKTVVGIAYDPGQFGGDLTLTTSGGATLTDPQLVALEEGVSVPADGVVYWFVGSATGDWIAFLPETDSALEERVTVVEEDITALAAADSALDGRLDALEVTRSFVRVTQTIDSGQAHASGYVTPTSFTEINDIGSNFASGIFTAARTAAYTVEAKALHLDADENENMYLYVSRNGASSGNDLLHISTGVGEADGSRSLYLTAGDTVRLKIQTDNAGTIQLQVVNFAIIEH